MKENNLFFFLLIPVVSRKFTDPFFPDGKLYIYRRRINTIINLCGSFTQTLTSPNLVWQSSWISQNAFSPLFLITLEWWELNHGKNINSKWVSTTLFSLHELKPHPKAGWGTKIPHAMCPINKIKQLKRERKVVVQWLRLQAPSAEGPSSIPGWGTRSHIPNWEFTCHN